MKIKLITFAPQPNFGTSLQSYALNYVLRQMGHDVEFIYNALDAPPLFRHYVVKLVKLLLPDSAIALLKKKRQRNKLESRLLILQLPHHPILYILSKLPGYKRIYKACKCVNPQWRKVYKFTHEDDNFKMRRIYTSKQYHEVETDADLFITGSDQIWNPYCGGFNPMMFLEFVREKKCVSYSSSISQPMLPKSIEQRIKRDLLKFQHIGVREQRSVDLLNELLGRTDVRLVVDPTYLLSAEEWTDFGEKAELEFPLPEKYIFCYFVGCKRKDVYERMVQETKQFTGIDNVITLECYDRPLNYGGGMLYKDAGPYEWVYLLKHASYVCMDSFHATVFALKFQKDFVHALKNEDTEVGSQNTRMYDILHRYGLSHKIYKSYENTSWQMKIDYSNVDTTIESEIKESLKFLVYEIEN